MRLGAIFGLVISLLFLTRTTVSADTVNVYMDDRFEFRMTMPAVLYLDDTVLRIHNVGVAPHAFLIHNTDSSIFYYLKDSAGAPYVLEPGEKRILITPWPITGGAYKAQCPLEEHDDQGMMYSFSVVNKFRGVEANQRFTGFVRVSRSAGMLDVQFESASRARELGFYDELGKLRFRTLIPPGSVSTSVDLSRLGSGLLFSQLGHTRQKIFLGP
jgi:hypothetical protein